MHALELEAAVDVEAAMDVGTEVILVHFVSS